MDIQNSWQCLPKANRLLHLVLNKTFQVPNSCDSLCQQRLCGRSRPTEQIHEFGNR